LRATHISIPQVGHTHAVLLCKPVWIWGAEMGANEFGVTIGNETVWAAEPVREDDGLIGMDLLRLALERADTARGAVDVIAGLLDQYGQGGNAGYRHPFYYHNGFIIADPCEAWVLETVGQYWIAEQVQDIRSISNLISIRGQGDLCHPDLVAHAVEQGWCKNAEEFDFATHYLPPSGTKEEGTQVATQGCDRAQRSMDLLIAQRGAIDEEFMMRVLRDHGEVPDWTPAKNRSNGTLCRHAGDDLHFDQTANSLVSVLGEGIQVHWTTVGAAPCTAIFKPFFMPFFMPTTPQPAGGPTPPNKYDPSSAWWVHEELHRLVLQDYQARLPVYQADRDALEARFLEETRAIVEDAKGRLSAGENVAGLLGDFASRVSSEALAAEADWIIRVRNTPPQQKVEPAYRIFWKKFNKLDEMPEIA
ncbi:MAG TPA: C69 family dipeptidase, partial [Candidatus Lokiarchaeia archaeon]|nr:C69 family dipeptidase [Candidatus Lokiarchaeia archaeon]